MFQGKLGLPQEKTSAAELNGIDVFPEAVSGDSDSGDAWKSPVTPTTSYKGTESPMASRAASVCNPDEDRSNGVNFWLYALLGMLALGLCGYGVSQFIPMVLLSPGFVATMSTAAIYPPLVMMVLGLVLAIVMLVLIVKVLRSDNPEVGSVSAQSMSQTGEESKYPSPRGSNTGPPLPSNPDLTFPNNDEGPELTGNNGEHEEHSVGNDEQPNTEKEQPEREQLLNEKNGVDGKDKDNGVGVGLDPQIKNSVKTPVNSKPSQSVGTPTKKPGFASQTPAILCDAVGRSNSPCDPPTSFFKRVSKSSNNNKAAEVYRESPKKKVT